jgi:hypothetical protein
VPKEPARGHPTERQTMGIPYTNTHGVFPADRGRRLVWILPKQGLTMRLKFGHLCDYATVDNGGKPIIIGAFDMIFVNAKLAAEAAAGPDVPVFASPRFYLMMALEASTNEGTVHDVQARLLDADGQEKGAVTFHNVKFGTRLEGHATTAYLAHMMDGVPLPFGDYVFELGVLRKSAIGVSVERVGEIPFHVVDIGQITPLAPQAAG